MTRLNFVVEDYKITLGPTQKGLQQHFPGGILMNAILTLSGQGKALQIIHVVGGELPAPIGQSDAFAIIFVDDFQYNRVLDLVRNEKPVRVEGQVDAAKKTAGNIAIYSGNEPVGEGESSTA